MAVPVTGNGGPTNHPSAGAHGQDARPMRRKRHEILDRAEIDEVLDRAEVLYLALNDQPAPYVVPLNFGRADGALWFHCAAEGAKLDLLQRDPEVGFAVTADARVEGGPAACDFTTTARSVVGRGRARIVTGEEERQRGLEAILRHYGAEPPFALRPDSLERTCVVRVDIVTVRGKRVGSP